MTSSFSGTPSGSDFRADTIGTEAYRRLKGGLSHASVHSSYSGAVNVITRLGLVSLVPPSTGNGPINVTINGDFHVLSTSAARGDAVTLADATILIASGPAVSLAGAKKYAPPWKFSRSLIGDEYIRRNVELARETTIVHGSFSGMGGLLHSVRGDVLSVSTVGLDRYSLLALPHVRSLIRGLGDKNITRIRTAAKNIIGLGIGLTPSADDVLSGLMVAVLLSAKNGLAPGPFYSRAARAIAETSVGRSGALSEEYLKQASLGRSNEKVTRLVENICSGTVPEVVKSTSELVAMGHASGTDTAVGVVLGICFLLQEKRRRTMR